LTAFTHVRFGSIGVLLLLLAGCAQDPPSCNDPSTISLVKNVFRQQILPKKFRSVPSDVFDRMTRLELPTPEKYEKEIGKYSCAARFSVDASKGIDLKALLEPGVASVEDLPVLVLALQQLSEDGSVGENILDKELTTETDGTKRYKFDISYTSQRVDKQHIVRIDGVLPMQTALTGALIFPRSVGGKASQPTPNPAMAPTVSSLSTDKTAGMATPTPIQQATPSQPSSASAPNKYDSAYSACVAEAGAMSNTVVFLCSEAVSKLAKEDMTNYYKQLEIMWAGNLDKLAALENTQKSWISYRNNYCKTTDETQESCLATVNSQRALELKSMRDR